MEKPKKVTLAVNLLWTTLAIGAVRGFLTGLKTTPEVGPVFIAVVILITLAIMSWLILKISAGRNWARITFAVLFAMGLPMIILMFMTPAFTQNPINSTLALIQTVFQGYALYLIFTHPGKEWFQKR